MEFMLRDFIITQENMIFSVVSYSHPEDRVIAFLRYFPSSRGDRERDEKKYEKVNSVAHSFKFLERNFPEYIFKATNLNTKLQAVPLDKIEEHLSPRKRLREIVRAPRDEVEEYIKKLSSLFPEIPLENKGVTGSVLVGLHTSTSDIDFVIYGIKEHSKARRRLKELFGSGEVRDLSREEWLRAYKKRFPSEAELSFEEFLFYERRKYHKGVFGSKIFDLLMVHGQEIKLELWGNMMFRRLSKYILKAEVVDSSLAFDYPAVYKISCSNSKIKEVVSFTHTYAGQAFEGEKIVAEGYLEEVIPEGHLRILVGTTREAIGEYIKLDQSNPPFRKGLVP